MQWERGTVALVGGSAPDVPLELLLFTRMLSASVGLACTTWVVTSGDLTLLTQYFPQSGMRPVKEVSVTMSRVHRLSTYTVQSWTLLTVYFVVATACTALFAAGQASETGGGGGGSVLGMVGWLLFEGAFTTALIVTIIVSFVLVPGIKWQQKWANLHQMMRLRPLLLHNFNVVMIGLDLVLNRMSFARAHVLAPLFWGLWYVLFSWAWLRRVGVVYYPFLDPTLPGWMSVSLSAVLLAVCGAFFGLGLVYDAVIAAYLPHLSVRLVCVLVISLAISWTPWTGHMPPACVAFKPKAGDVTEFSLLCLKCRLNSSWLNDPGLDAIIAKNAEARELERRKLTKKKKKK